MIKYFFEKETFTFLFVFLAMMGVLYLQMNPVEQDAAAGNGGNPSLLKAASLEGQPNKAESQKERPSKIKRIVNVVKEKVQSVTGLRPKNKKWGYSGSNGPAGWQNLKKEYKLCGAGKRQSPVKLSSKQILPSSFRPELEFYYSPIQSRILLENGNVQMPIEGGNFLRVDGIDFQLKKITFKTPAENILDDKLYPMEIQLLHKDQFGRILIVSIFVQASQEANFMIGNLPIPEKYDTDQKIQGMMFDPGEILPKNRSYLAFDGSLTVPPCTESIGWAVLADPIDVSSQKINRFLRVTGKNARPAQKLNGRQVMVVRF